MATLVPLPLHSLLHQKPHLQTTNNHRLFRLSAQSRETIDPVSSVQYTPGVLDHVFLNLFRNKMAQEVGWDSEKPGYDGLIDVANRLMVARTNSETKDAAIAVSPVVVRALQNHICSCCSRKTCCCHARVTALSCQWLMGTCIVNNVDLPDGSSLPSGVFVERCKYLEESKCVGICVNTCKLPTQEFFMDHMGVPLLMEPNFSDYSCQFKFGISPPEDDSTLKEPCLEVCPNATRRRTAATNTHEMKCPKA
ncbi:beta-carotene isomerase D27, chloroplastic isoform X3 [Helianthus annuus]|uniref:beta-carotene isomerase D27, chloroplastic isoform X3 n=1 Tax=Helianthus annuus TaxID=4232 RepID=UPI0016533CF9|nr:beta-carotene isomerase D27, chloroplastic isoform X3 [Helianthus annuus]XP_035844509.1 beta-carotene isomerase D27, chloroplastic isoform X3 [Helianthus annuus]